MSVPATTSATDPAASAGQTTGGSDARQVPAPVSGDKTYTQTEVENLIKERLARQKDTMEGQAAAAREKAEREAAELKAKEQGEYQSLAASEKARADKAEQEKADAERTMRERLIRTEIKAAATSLNFADPADAYRFVDFAAVTFNAAGDPENVAQLLTDLVDPQKGKKTYLVAGAATGGPAAIPRTPNGSTVTADQFKQQEEEKARRSGRYAAL